MPPFVIGGLITSTLITLVFAPAMYTLFEEGVAGLRHGMKHDADERGAVGATPTILAP